MRRKVNRVGTSTLTVSLPSKWVQQQGIKQGDELELAIDRSVLSLTKEGFSQGKKSLTVNIDDFEHLTLMRYFDVLYRDGYDTMVFIHNKDTIYYSKKDSEVDVRQALRTMVSRAVGSEIVSQTPKQTKIECLVSASDQDLERIEKRIYYLFKELLDEILAKAKKGVHGFYDEVYAMHDNILKFTNYLLRELEASDRPLVEKQLTYSVFMVVDKLVDKARHVVEKIILFGKTEKVDDLLKRIFEVFEGHFLALHAGEFPSHILAKRYMLVREIRQGSFTPEELQVLMEANHFLDVLNEFVELVIAKKVGGSP